MRLPPPATPSFFRRYLSSGVNGRQIVIMTSQLSNANGGARMAGTDSHRRAPQDTEKKRRRNEVTKGTGKRRREEVILVSVPCGALRWLSVEISSRLRRP